MTYKRILLFNFKNKLFKYLKITLRKFFYMLMLQQGQLMPMQLQPNHKMLYCSLHYYSIFFMIILADPASFFIINHHELPFCQLICFLTYLKIYLECLKLVFCYLLDSKQCLKTHLGFLLHFILIDPKIHLFFLIFLILL